MSESCAVSSVKLPAAKAKELACKKIDWIDEYRKNREKVFLEEEAARCNRNWFHRLFRRKDFTPEAIKEIEEGKMRASDLGLWSPLEWIRVSGADTLVLCGRVITAAEHVDEITLSLEDLDRLT